MPTTRPSPFHLILSLALMAQLALAQDQPELAWHELDPADFEGRAWVDEPRVRDFDRFPAVAQSMVTEKVWDRSRDSAGMLIRFRTDAARLWVDYDLWRDRIHNVNITAIGASGVDLYARDAAGKWRWAGRSLPYEQHVRGALLGEMTSQMREFALYLPYYNGMERIALGIPPEASLEVLPPRDVKPIIFYGTSITHGASASRAGMTHVAILGRRLDRPVINLGFSGQGRMHAEVGELLTRVDAEVLVIDCLPNMNAEQVRERCIPLVHQLRAAHPDTPIVLVEDRRNTNAWLTPTRDAHHNANHTALRESYATLEAEGVTSLYYIPGDWLLGHDGEGTTDGSHPNDLGFMRQADVFEPVLRAALRGADR